MRCRALPPPQGARRALRWCWWGKTRRAASMSAPRARQPPLPARSEEHTSELQSLMRISYAVFCLKKKKKEGKKKIEILPIKNSIIEKKSILKSKTHEVNKRSQILSNHINKRYKYRIQEDSINRMQH